MTIDYILKIHCPDEVIDSVSEILGAEPTERKFGYWGFGLTERGTNKPVPYVDRFLDLLDGKFDLLEEIGVSRDYITVWLNAEYSDDCGFQFLAGDLKRLGDRGIDLCIECWEACEEYEPA